MTGDDTLRDARRRRRGNARLWIAAVSLLLGGALLLWGPGGLLPDPHVDPTATTDVVPRGVVDPTTAPAATTPGDVEESAEPEELPHQDEAAEPFAPATWDTAAEQGALAAGQSVMQAWFDPVPAQQWWAQLGPLMNVNGAAIYATVDPELIAPATLTGDPSVTAAPSPYYAEISVPTTAGVYVVSLTRDSQGAAWLAERLLQPETTPPLTGAES